MKRISVALAAVVALSAAQARAADTRELVTLPAPMQEHMLANMRDHLLSLEEILTALAKGDAKTAAGVAEQRIGMSSLILHDAAHLGKFMPEPMQRMGTGLHHAASRFAVAVRDAELDPVNGARTVHQALADVTASCNACHAAYRIR